MKKFALRLLKATLDHITNPWQNARLNQPRFGQICHVIVKTDSGEYIHTSGIIPSHNGLVWMLSDGKKAYNIEVPFLSGPVVAWRYASLDDPGDEILDKWRTS